MLVLLRRIGESIMIGDDVVVTVLAVDGHNKVKIGIAAPRNVPVHREEVYEQVMAETEATNFYSV